MRKRASKSYILPSLSLFFPAYNEAGNIEEAVKQALTILPKVAKKYEIIIVNDGSHDATLPIAKRLARTNKQVRIVSQANKGYGSALKLGFVKSRYEWIFYSDSDLQFDISELQKFLRHTHKHQVIIGFRTKRAEGWNRQVFATGLKIWNKLLLSFPLSIRDIDCAFKLIHRSALTEIQPLFSDGAMISTELLLKLHRNRYDIKQIGVSHYARRIGKPTGNNFGVITKAIQDTFVLQKHMFKQTFLGKYAYQTRHLNLSAYASLIQ